MLCRWVRAEIDVVIIATVSFLLHRIPCSSRLAPRATRICASASAAYMYVNDLGASLQHLLGSAESSHDRIERIKNAGNLGVSLHHILGSTKSSQDRIVTAAFELGRVVQRVACARKPRDNRV